MTVSIQDDMIVEDQFERFFINLRRYESAVILSQPTASVSIEDNDSESSNCMHTKSYTCIRMSIFCNFLSTSVVTIGFSEFYSVLEDAGSIRIIVLVLMNCSTRDIVVTLSTLDDTARGIGLCNS